MALLEEGIWPCTVLSANHGENPQRPGVTRVQITARIDEGPSKGRVCTYEDDVTQRSNIYVMRSCEAVGWKGGPQGDDLDTLAADVAAWVKATGGKSTIEIKHIMRKTGAKAGTIWDKPNSFGRGPKPLAKASNDAAADAREAMREARKLAASGAEPPPEDSNVPPPSDDDIPF